MLAVAILASITLAPPAPNVSTDTTAHSNNQLPVEAYIITGKATATLLPAPLRKAVAIALTSPQFYKNSATQSPALRTQSAAILTNNLTSAFKSRDLGTIMMATTSCVHLAVRAAIPGDNDAVNNLIAAHHKRLAFEVRIDPDRLTNAHDIATLSTRISATSSHLRIHWLPDSVDHNLGLIEARLEQAALMSAKMLTEAWHAAGDLDLTPANQTTSPQTQETVKHVASRNSKVFHKRTCPHVARIKRANLVRFNSFATAKRSGRSPCKTCKPTE